MHTIDFVADSRLDINNIITKINHKERKEHKEIAVL